MATRGRWVTHKGDGIPGDAHGPVDVEFRDGDIASYPDGESLGGWDHEGHEFDVVMYRPRPDRNPTNGSPRG